MVIDYTKSEPGAILAARLRAVRKGAGLTQNELAAAQKACRDFDESGVLTKIGPACYCRNVALRYFVSQWMGRSGKSGTSGEFGGGLPIRWEAGGGDSNTRYRSAIEGLEAFDDVMTRSNFYVGDALEFLESVNDVDGNGVYCDAPWPEAGAKYRHKVDDSTFHAELRNRLEAFQNVRVVVRYGADPLIGALYSSERGWTRHNASSRKQSGKDQSEWLFVRNGV